MHISELWGLLMSIGTASAVGGVAYTILTKNGTQRDRKYWASVAALCFITGPLCYLLLMDDIESVGKLVAFSIIGGIGSLDLIHGVVNKVKERIK